MIAHRLPILPSRAILAATMFERFTDQARQVVVFAQEEARLMRHAHIGTEHFVVGLARLDDDVASSVLREHGLTPEKARAEVARVVGVGDDGEHGQLPFTPAAHDALEATLSEALGLGHERVEPAHLLLGILRQPDAIARRMLLSVGSHPPDIRAELVRRLGEHGHEPAAPNEATAAAAVPVKLGDTLVGDLGHPNVDGQLLLEILGRRGAVAAWLRERGVDEHAVRRMLGEG